jgi:hypothetical protein
MLGYVIAKSSPRMHIRANTSRSGLLLEALFKVKPTDIASEGFRIQQPPSEEQICRDKAFLRTLKSDTVREYLEDIGVSIPKLSQISLESGSTLYSAETSPEVHQFLTGVLRNLLTSTKRIYDRIGTPTRKQVKPSKSPESAITIEEQGRGTGTLTSEQSASPGPITTADEFKHTTADAALAAHIFWSFMYSSAAQDHLRRINPLLETREREVTEARAKAKAEAKAKAKAKAIMNAKGKGKGKSAHSANRGEQTTGTSAIAEDESTVSPINTSRPNVTLTQTSPRWKTQPMMRKKT